MECAEGWRQSHLAEHILPESPCQSYRLKPRWYREAPAYKHIHMHMDTQAQPKAKYSIRTHDASICFHVNRAFGRANACTKV